MLLATFLSFINFLMAVNCDSAKVGLVYSLNERLSFNNSQLVRKAIHLDPHIHYIYKNHNFFSLDSEIKITYRQTKRLEMTITFNADLSVKVHNKINNSTYFFNLKDLLIQDKKYEEIVFLGAGGQGFVFRVKYNDGEEETLKLYYGIQSISKSFSDLMMQTIVNNIFKKNSSKVAVAEYQFNKFVNIKIKEEDSGKERSILASVLRISNIKNMEILDKLKKQFSPKQNETIVDDIRYFIRASFKDTATFKSYKEKTVGRNNDGQSFTANLTKDLIEELLNIKMTSTLKDREYSLKNSILKKEPKFSFEELTVKVKTELYVRNELYNRVEVNIYFIDKTGLEVKFFAEYSRLNLGISFVEQAPYIWFIDPD